MRALVAGLEKVIEGEVIGSELFDDESGQFDLEAELTVRCDNGTCFTVYGLLVDVEILREAKEWVM